ncbi:MAG: hypothetical protein ABI680_07575, partial [Chthoniobacteraceae bacterium]
DCGGPGLQSRLIRGQPGRALGKWISRIWNANRASIEAAEWERTEWNEIACAMAQPEGSVRRHVANRLAQPAPKGGAAATATSKAGFLSLRAQHIIGSTVSGSTQCG